MSTKQSGSDTQPTNPQITFVTIEHRDEAKTETATYFRGDDHAAWEFVTVEKGPVSRLVSRDITAAQGVATRSTSLITHLRRGGVWQETVTDFEMQPSTPRQRIETEIADLRAEAHARDERDRVGGWGGCGSILTAKADAMQHVLDVLTTDTDS